MKKMTLNNKGVSLPLTMGLLIILMIGSSAIFLLISRSFRGLQRLEASNRAYFSAESGLENALYELSPHFLGYQTPALDADEVRRDVFGTTPIWESQWAIESMDTDGDFEGALREKEKLILAFYQDDSGDNDLSDNEINTSSANISQIDTSDNFSITFQIPFDGSDGSSYSNFFSSQSYQLRIDNDRDLGTAGRTGDQSNGIEGLNEDGRTDTGICGAASLNEDDGDCDGKEDEDNLEDNVILWRIYDDEGRILSPLPGCLTGTGTADDPLGSEICEKDFARDLSTNKIQITLDEGVRGISETGATATIGQFINPSYDGRGTSGRVEIEFLISSPMLQVSNSGNQKGIPYFEYLVDANDEFGLPLPFFNIQSDGWYREFKQSITTQVIPRTTTTLSQITIIQNQ